MGGFAGYGGLCVDHVCHDMPALGRKRTLGFGKRTPSFNGFVPVTKDSGYFPSIRSLVPNDQKFGLAEAFARFNLTERVMSLFERAIPIYGKDLHRPGRKYTPKVAANILASFLDVVLSRPCDTTFVVVKLNVWIQVTRMRSKLIWIAAVIKRIEEFRIPFQDGAS